MEKLEKYVEVRGKEPFNWNKAIAAMIKGNKDDKYNAKDLYDRSGDWVTCACGNLCDIIPRDVDGTPYDGRLEDLGFIFHQDVAIEDWHKAKLTLSQIEKRSAVLINRFLEEKKKQETK